MAATYIGTPFTVELNGDTTCIETTMELSNTVSTSHGKYFVDAAEEERAYRHYMRKRQMMQNDNWGISTKTCSVWDEYETMREISNKIKFYYSNSPDVSTTYIKKLFTAYQSQWITTGTTSTITVDSYWDRYEDYVRSPREIPLSERMQGIIQSRMAPAIIVRRQSLLAPADIREQRARQTLRRIVGDDQYRSYLKQGFVSVRGKSGKWYQVFGGHKFANVWVNGKIVERLCIQLNGSFPSTDSTIMRCLLIWNDEDTLWAKSIKHGPGYDSDAATAVYTFKQPDSRPLMDILSEMKVGKKVIGTKRPMPSRRPAIIERTDEERNAIADQLLAALDQMDMQPAEVAA